MRFVALTGGVGLLLLSACGEDLSPAEKAARDARDIAMVKEVQNSEPPLQPIVPDAILYPDLEKHGIAGEACNYAPGTSLGTRVIAMSEIAYMKIDGTMTQFATDPGAQQLPAGSWSKYDGRAYSVQLQIEGEGDEALGSEAKTDYEGHVVVRDEYGRVVFDGTGLAQCGA
ncbi:hypothetical protein [Altericroceibacterium endophyticum]|uniref:Uncharacterized protein n=1 Tax=Altericroceibacterium endophyticum TaxID=1808508 RepID=A0A6I4T2Y6_9SPHN|nr:hypothetical protein [Altericroceibacterium endophyticum]MXO64539.1 hypothetical protein [Altericroceibacterium endophyticum]